MQSLSTEGHYSRSSFSRWKTQEIWEGGKCLFPLEYYKISCGQNYLFKHLSPLVSQSYLSLLFLYKIYQQSVCDNDRMLGPTLCPGRSLGGGIQLPRILQGSLVNACELPPSTVLYEPVSSRLLL